MTEKHYKLTVKLLLVVSIIMSCKLQLQYVYEIWSINKIQ